MSKGANAWRVGILFGLLSAALALVNTLLEVSGTLAPEQVYTLSFVLFGSGILLFAVGGGVAGRWSGSIAAGALAGLLAAIVSALLWTLTNVAFALILPDVTTSYFNTVASNNSEPVGMGALPVIYLVLGAVALAIGVLVGLGAGAIGGLLGRIGHS